MPSATAGENEKNAGYRSGKSRWKSTVTRSPARIGRQLMAFASRVAAGEIHAEVISHHEADIGKRNVCIGFADDPQDGPRAGASMGVSRPNASYTAMPVTSARPSPWRWSTLGMRSTISGGAPGRFRNRERRLRRSEVGRIFFRHRRQIFCDDLVGCCRAPRIRPESSHMQRSPIALTSPML